jgi:hypothetical protein
MVISFNTLNSNLRKAIKEKTLSPEELRSVSVRMKASHKKTTKLFTIILGVFVVFFGTIMALGMSKGGVFLPSIVMFVASMAAAWAIIWFTQVGIIKLQFNGLIKKYYPELYSEVKV